MSKVIEGKMFIQVQNLIDKFNIEKKKENNGSFFNLVCSGLPSLEETNLGKSITTAISVQ